MSKANSIGKSIISNVGGYVISVIVAFIIAPITIHSLGDARYGAWVLVSELIGYYGLLDLGIRGAVTYNISKYAALNQQEDVKKTLSSAFWVLAALGILVLLVGVILTVSFPYIFRTDSLNLAEVKLTLLIMSGLIACSLPMNAFGGALVGKERFDLSSGIEVINRILTAIMVYVTLKSGGGLVALAVVQSVGRIFSWSVTLVACRKVLGGIFVKPSWFSLERVRELASYGLHNAVGQLALLIIYRTDLTIVGMFAGIKFVTFYSIAKTLVTYASSFCSSITYAFTPRFTRLQSSEDNEKLNDLFFRSMRIIGMVVTGLTAGILVFGKDFIRLWLGSSYITGDWTSRSDIIMAILILANLPRMLQSISWQRLYAMARVRFLMWLNLSEAAANLVLSVLLTLKYGPVGAALGTFFPLMISHVVVMPIYTSRTFNIPFLELLRKGFAKPLITGLLMICINLLCVKIAPPHTWLLFCCDTLIAALLGFVLCLFIGLSGQERKDLLIRLQNRSPVPTT